MCISPFYFPFKVLRHGLERLRLNFKIVQKITEPGHLTAISSEELKILFENSEVRQWFQNADDAALCDLVLKQCKFLHGFFLHCRWYMVIRILFLSGEICLRLVFPFDFICGSFGWLLQKIHNSLGRRTIFEGT